MLRLQNLIRQTLDRRLRPTKNEWNELREKLLLNAVNKCMIDRIILDNCFPDKIDAGKSYIDYLKESKQNLRQGTWIRVLKLYCNASKCGTRITAQHQQEISEMCQYLRGTHSEFSVDLGAAIIRGLLLTPDWRKSLDIVESIRSANAQCYSAIIQRAIQEDDDHLVWSIFGKINIKDICLNCQLFPLYIGYCARNVSTFRQNIDRMLTSIGNERMLISSEVSNELQHAFRRVDYGCNITTVSHQGECHSCGKYLRSAVKLTDDEFNELRSHFWNNISTKSTQKEIESFKPFIDGTRTYDIVIDGLNTNRINDNWMAVKTHDGLVNEIRSSQLANVVRYFVDRRKTVLVIGREHMTRWKHSQMDYISKNADLFLADNTSEDDEFFIYSALKSGPNTKIVTRDTLQNHANRLDGRLKTVFRRWQQQHQFRLKIVDDPEIVEFHECIEFDIIAQQTDDGCWHIPFEDGPRCIFQENALKLWKNWMCVSK